MASGQTVISRLTTAEPSPPGLPRTRVLEPTRTSPSRVAGRSRQAQLMVRPFGAAAISTSRTAARSRQAPRKTLPSRPRGSLAATNASLNVNGVEYGVYAHKGITLDHANVTVRASKGRYSSAIALFTYPDDIVVRTAPPWTRLRKARFRCILHQKRSTQRGGWPHLHQRLRCQGHSPLCRERRRPHPYGENQDGETGPGPQGENIGIIAQTSEASHPQSSRSSAAR